MAANFIQVKFDPSSVISWLDQLRRDQVPFATRVALNKTAQDAQAENRREMAKVFDRPTPFTLNSTRVQFATKQRLEAKVYLKDEGNKGGGSAVTRLAPQVFGGTREHKRMEKALRSAGLLGATEQAYPGSGATFDQYGNMSRGEIVQILAWFRAFKEGGYRANMTDKGRARLSRGTKTKRGVRYFFKPDSPGRGIYRATQFAAGSAIKPVLIFGRLASYKPRLHMGEVMQRTVDARFPFHFEQAMADAIRTAR